RCHPHARVRPPARGRRAVPHPPERGGDRARAAELGDRRRAFRDPVALAHGGDPPRAALWARRRARARHRRRRRAARAPARIRARGGRGPRPARPDGVRDLEAASPGDGGRLRLRSPREGDRGAPLAGGDPLRPPMRLAYTILGLLNVANGVWMLLAPASWYYRLPAGVPDTGPLNPHFVRDVGAA